ncbi:MAG: filamentous hemagglutinin N-terminal domain-containing protein, partial [Candidatus Caenarcaniphilales bacterium]|nr:filamentous hemagglutinin N-terminal domain-containing protein [Candidatus Caenarcaniphilales bacterium]
MKSSLTHKTQRGLKLGLKRKATAFILLSLFSFQSLGGFAATLPDTLPTNYQTQAGSVSFDTSTLNTLNVNSSTAKSIVNYDTFSIGSNATVNFNLPSAGSAILNRVTGNSLSEIFGRMNSNGNIFLINPNGILFGAGSEINVGGLVASTLNISNSNFLNGNYVFNRLNGQATGYVTNNGTIDSKNFTAFLAGAVSNSGDITSRTVGFGVGDKISLSFGGNVGMELTVNEALKQKAAGFNTAISNSGTIDSKFTEFEAFVSKSLYDSMVNNSGTIFATDLINDQGSFKLTSKVFDSVTNTYEATDENKLLYPHAVLDDKGTPDDLTDDELINTVETTAIGGNSYNSGNILADSISIQSGTFRNLGSVESNKDLSMLLSESVLLSLGLADRTLDHNPGNYPTEQMEPGLVQVDAFQYYYGLALSGTISFNQAFQFLSENTTGYVTVPGLVPHRSETITYGLLNQGTLKAGHDLTVESKIGDIVNRNNYDASNALIEGGNNLTLKAIADKPLDGSDPLYTPSVINQRAGYNTTQSYEERDIGGTDHDFTTWNDVAPSKNAILRSGNDLVIDADKNVVNSGGMIQAGVPSGGLDADGNPAVPTGDLKITAENFINNQPVLQQTIREHWIRERLFGNDHRERWYHNSLSSPPALVGADNMFLGLDGNFTNTGLIIAENDFNLGARDIINGLWGTKDARVENPPNFIPGTIIAKNININGIGSLLNSGWIYAEEDLDIKAQKIENIRRTATKIANVKHNRGLFKGSTIKHIAYEEIQEGGILESGGKINITADDSFYNRGGLVKAETDLTITAPQITNTVTEGTAVVTWNPGNLGKLLGKKNWGHKAVYEAGQIVAGGDITLDAKTPAGSNGTILNQGSDIISTGGDVNIKADKLVEQNWVASTYTASDKLSFSGLKIERKKETAHVTRGSTIAALDGNVNIEVGDSSTDGTFRNIASDVIANKNIDISAKNIEISDAIHQSMNEYDSLALNFNAPSTISLDY